MIMRVSKIDRYDSLFFGTRSKSSTRVEKAFSIEVRSPFDLGIC